MSMTPALGKWSEEIQKFKVSLGYVTSLRPTWAPQDTASKKETPLWALSHLPMQSRHKKESGGHTEPLIYSKVSEKIQWDATSILVITCFTCYTEQKEIVHVQLLQKCGAHKTQPVHHLATQCTQTPLCLSLGGEVGTQIRDQRCLQNGLTFFFI